MDVDVPTGHTSLNGKLSALASIHGYSDDTPSKVDETPNGLHEPSLEEMEGELPDVADGQVSLGELVSRMAQSIYAELIELAET